MTSDCSKGCSASYKGSVSAGGIILSHFAYRGISLSFLDALLGKFRRTPAPEAPAPTIDRNIVALLVYPRDLDKEPVGTYVPVRDDTYYLSWPVRIPEERLYDAVYAGRLWLNEVLGVDLRWYAVERIDSRMTLLEWRDRGIQALKAEVEERGKPLRREYVYLGFVRGMGGYAGGLSYSESGPGYAMVGDICLEALCSYPDPNAASALLDESWPDNARSRDGQTAAFLHELLHALGLPHPDAWPPSRRPNWSDTIMGYWWNMPRFARTKGLTGREIEKVLQWLD